MSFEDLYEREYLDAQRFRPRELAQLGRGMFHITGHAVDDLHCFGDAADKREFLNRFERHLSARTLRDSSRRAYRKLDGVSALVAYCILDNHFHLLIQQLVRGGAAELMNSVLNSYGKYFNSKYGGRTGSIWRDNYSSTQIGDSLHGKRALAYVTQNHETKRESYRFCSHDFYVGARNADWINVEAGLWFFDGDPEAYSRYLATEGAQALARKIARRAERPISPRRWAPRGPATHIARPENPRK